jgi:hypothetical protein
MKINNKLTKIKMTKLLEDSKVETRKKIRKIRKSE